jgi:hypothetical protein
MELLFAAIIKAAVALGPIGGLGWLFAIAMALFIIREIRGESKSEIKLRNKIESLNTLHAAALAAQYEHRINDLKTIAAQYDQTVKEVLSALRRFKP